MITMNNFRLNHPNVVRYYAAWIESTEYNGNTPMSTPSKNTKSLTPLKGFDSGDSSIVFAAGDASSVSFAPIKNNKHAPPTSSSTSSSDDDDTASSSSSSSEEESRKGFFRKPKPSVSGAPKIHTIFSPITAASKSGINSEFDIIFDDEDGAANDKFLQRLNEDEDGDNAEESRIDEMENLPKMLYIQMEYCKGNTLKTLIDSGKLYTDTNLIWRLFRQILNGLVHLH